MKLDRKRLNGTISSIRLLACKDRITKMYHHPSNFHTSHPFLRHHTVRKKRTVERFLLVDFTLFLVVVHIVWTCSDLGHNELTGTIPKDLETMLSLQVL